MSTTKRRMTARCEGCGATIWRVPAIPVDADHAEPGPVIDLDVHGSLHGYYSLNLATGVAKERERRGPGMMRPHSETCRR